MIDFHYLLQALKPNCYYIMSIGIKHSLLIALWNQSRFIDLVIKFLKRSIYIFQGYSFLLLLIALMTIFESLKNPTSLDSRKEKHIYVHIRTKKTTWTKSIASLHLFEVLKSFINWRIVTILPYLSQVHQSLSFIIESDGVWPFVTASSE